jgi:predicted ribosomally synthesized peptide with SipW-like signal peptide
VKKILGLTIAALLVIGLVGGGTWAYFSDPETSSGNVLAVGKLDLNIDGGDSDTTIFESSISGVAPGDAAANEYISLTNVGDMAGELDIEITAITNDESIGSTEYEADVIGGAGIGELSQWLDIVLWIDADESGTFNTGDIELNISGAAADINPWATTTNETLDFTSIDDYLNINFDAAFASLDETGGTNDEVDLYVTYQVSTSADNTAQGDSVDFTVTFTLEQADND